MAVVTPERLRASPLEPDEIYPGRQKLVLSFFLPPGAYATMLIKRLSLL
jgi:tRNA pseudouridine13 synthase